MNTTINQRFPISPIANSTFRFNLSILMFLYCLSLLWACFSSLNFLQWDGTYSGTFETIFSTFSTMYPFLQNCDYHNSILTIFLTSNLWSMKFFMCPEASLEEGSVTSVKSKLKVSKTISYKTIFRVFTGSKQ